MRDEISYEFPKFNGDGYAILTHPQLSTVRFKLICDGKGRL